jgi:PKD repeat protein
MPVAKERRQREDEGSGLRNAPPLGVYQLATKKEVCMQSAHTRFRSSLFALVSMGMWMFSTGAVHAYPGGVTGYSGASGSTCGSCHSGAAAPPVTLTGPATLGTGAVGNYTLTMQRSGSNARGGMDVSASAGTLTNPGSGTRAMGSEITHGMSNNVPATGISWTFDWQAPSAPGTYTIYGAVASTNGSGTGGDGTAAKTLTVTVTAMNQPPVARISGPTTAVEGAVVTFNGSSSSDPDGSIAAYDWNFGDGSAGAGATVTHTYVAGKYTVTLTVTDNAGATSSATQTVTVTAAGQPQPPVADPAGPYTGTVGHPVQCNGSGSHDPDGSIARYVWDFGDGTSASTMSPTHVYTTAGTYTLRLTVTDDNGLSGSAQTTAAVSAAPPTTGGGESLYDNHCASCHGPAGRGGPDGSVVGEDAKDIAEAIREVPEMRPLGNLDAAQIEAIAAYLGMGQNDETDREHERDHDQRKRCRKGEHGKGKQCRRNHRERD